MAHDLAVKIAPGDHADLSAIPTDATGGLDEKEADKQREDLLDELHDLQELMYGAQTHALLAILQGRDASGKDGIINHVFGGIDPQGLQVTSFKVPTAEEAAHDFLWRVHRATPGKGIIGVFNRSQYEQVLVVRVHQLAPAAEIEAAYDQINRFERLLSESGTLILKFYLHISKDEQRKQLLDREKKVSKAWKLNPGDWAERRYWDDYTAAYEAALSRCSTEYAPWYVIPGDHKWAGRLAVAQVLVETLRPLRSDWEEKLGSVQEKLLAELAQIQKQ